MFVFIFVKKNPPIVINCGKKMCVSLSFSLTLRKIPIFHSNNNYYM